MMTAVGSLEPEWMTIIEAQQQELEELRYVVSSASPSPVRSSPLRPSSARSNRSAFAMYPSPSPVVDVGLVDLKRYAKLCKEVEALNAKLTRKDVENRELQAKSSHASRQVGADRALLTQREREVQLLTVQLTREGTAKNEAVERAARAMLQSEAATMELTEARRTIDLLRTELRVRSEVARDVERRQSETKDSGSALQAQIKRLEDQLHAMKRDKSALEEKMDAMELSHRQSSELETKYTAAMASIQTLEVVLEKQTTQMEKQQQAIVELDRINHQLQTELMQEQQRTQHHVTRQVESNVSLQHLIEDQVAELHDARSRRKELEETVAMQSEELIALGGWRKSALRRMVLQETTIQELQDSCDRLTKQNYQTETSRRRIVSELARTRKQIPHLRAAVQAVDDEVKRLNKTMVSCREREGNMSRVMREYAKRNRVLQEAVTATQQQLRHVSDSLRRSERRKTEIATETSKLKRGLVVERCQREDLLQQCIALEKCLLACQRSAFDSADRAKSVEKENAVLQDAMVELCAYTKELMTSQESLQHDLKELEVRGETEPQVFG
ncbi:hypothetical protein Poli38472_010262 [Pythium oligandrum]|uniref:Uncharacterized protein n=1 Tax=Pythium oligandrum TaxID=41045 RepID=A0A8K1C9L8_PYTOL|nr:hypothetical protein Poli38472_010262 [Pythium oligandrum]|eukprot:TMW58703.1 hypothetical protein Poli38472_010262 [Pythium oligandrum]